jgi:hypothetical protein
VGGDLRIDGPGTAIRVVGDGEVTRVTVAGRIPRAGGRGADLLRGLAHGGVVVEVADPRGRLLARAGAVRPSLAGRLLAGSPALRPTARGLIAGLRGTTSKENP